jgi:hypothetical protein
MKSIITLVMLAFATVSFAQSTTPAKPAAPAATVKKENVKPAVKKSEVKKSTKKSN